MLVGRYSGKGDAAVIVEGTVNGAARKFTYEVQFPDEATDNEFIPRLWATRRVGYLLDEIRLHGENAELRDEVTELARKYGIVTPYTAYLIVEDESHRERADAACARCKDLRAMAARARKREAWRELKERVGDKAVAGARYGCSSNSGCGGAGHGRRRARIAPGARAPCRVRPARHRITDERSKERLVQYSQQTQFVAGKSFFQNDKQWIDSAVQKHPNAKRVRIQFGSAEYFDLVAKQPKALPWLALGQNVQFVLDNTVYDIYE